MNKILVAILAILTMALKPITDPLPIGAAIPHADQKMQSILGRSVSFNDVKKTNGLLVMFSCNTCPVVKKYQLRTMEICKYAVGNNVGVILLNSKIGRAHV